jgi:Tol biopolymer transport system component
LIISALLAGLVAVSSPSGDRIVSVNHPVWSPARSEIAFSGTRASGTTELDIALPDGSSVRSVDGAVAYAGGPWWSPNGKYIAYSGSDGRADYIAVARRDGMVPPAQLAYGYSASWAPDSRRLAIGAEDPTGSPTWFAVVDRGTAVSRTIGPTTYPVWSPRGDVVAYSGSRTSIYRIELASRIRRRIGRGDDVAWSADGRFVALSSARSIYVSTANGRQRQRVFRARRLLPPAWSPRRRALAVLCDRGLFVVNVATQRAERVLGPLAWRWSNPGGPSWSRDGRRLVLAAGARLYIVDADGRHGHFVSLTEGPRRLRHGE